MLLDSNIIIYAAQAYHHALREFIKEHNPVVSVISYIEVLGFHRLDPEERNFLEQFFGASEQLPLVDPIIRKATGLRQDRKIGLGDSIIAATALVHRIPLVTHNSADFRWIAELDVIDPIS